MSITQQKNGKILMKCQSPQCGATLTKVLRVLDDDGYERRNGDDFEVTVRARTRATEANGTGGMQWWVAKTGVPAKVWEEMGVEEYGTKISFEFGDDVRKVRGRGKGDFQWQGTSEAEAPPLFPAIPDSLPKHISIWEGESDAGTARAAKLPLAFAATKGGKTKLPLGAFEALKERGVEEVTIGGDTDEPGIEFSTRLSRQALGAGLTVNTVRLETILDPFSGINDLNGVWRAAENQTIPTSESLLESSPGIIRWSGSRIRKSICDCLQRAITSSV